MTPIHSISRIVLIAAGLFLFSGCSLFQNRWEKVRSLDPTIFSQHGGVPFVEGNSLYLSSRTHSDALQLDINDPRYMGKAPFPLGKYWEWRNSHPTNYPVIPYPNRDVMIEYCRVGLFEYFSFLIDVDDLVKAIDQSPNESRGPFRSDLQDSGPVWDNRKDSEKKESVHNLIATLSMYLTHSLSFDLYHKGTYYGLASFTDQDAYDSVGFSPDALIEKVSFRSDRPVVFLDCKVGGDRVVMTHLFTMGKFNEYNDELPGFMNITNGRPFIFTTKGVWVLSPQNVWEEPAGLPVQMNIKDGVRPSFFINSEYLYVFGDSKDGSGPAIYRLPVSRI
jgi:hypothetical protein